MRPSELLQKWIAAFNRGDSDALAEMYAHDAVNHQVADEPVEGKEEIKEKFAREFANADMTCIVENVFEDGEWAIMEWKDPRGFRGCGFFQFQDGLIVFQRGYWDKLSFMKAYDLPLSG